MCEDDFFKESAMMPKVSDTPGKPGTHSVRICNQEHMLTGCDTDDIRHETLEKDPQTTEELPEGWVRHGTGLVLDVPITPRMKTEGAYKPQAPHYNFARETCPSPVKPVHRNLQQIDRDAVRRMRRDQEVKVRAARPSSDAREPRCSFKAQQRTPMRASVDVTREDKLAADQTNRKIAAMKRDHERELIQAKQQVLDHVDGLIKKYRQLAIDAVKVAREEQRKAETERRNAYDACVRYEEELKANVRSAISHLKQSAQEEQERLIAERDALQKRCADLTPLHAETFRPTLEHVSRQIASQFKDNSSFTIEMIDEMHSNINEQFSSFRDSMAKLMVNRFVEEGCQLSKEDADIFVECSLLAGSMFS